MTVWDRCLARRALGVGGLAAILTLLVVAATDGGGSWRSRLGMTAALTPVAGALGTLFALRTAADRGELRALAALGVDPGRAARGAAFGGVMLGVVSAVVAASPFVDLASLFPRAATAVWTIDAESARELTSGLRLLRDGSLTLDAPVSPSTARASMTGFAVAVIAMTALAAPAWIAVPAMSLSRRACVGSGLLVVAIVAFQLVAADRAPAAVLLVAPLAMLADAVQRRRQVRS